MIKPFHFFKLCSQRAPTAFLTEKKKASLLEYDIIFKQLLEFSFSMF